MDNRTPMDEAARWFLRLQSASADAATFQEWQHWLNASPDHRTAYDEVEETILRVRRVQSPPPLPSAEEMAADTYDGSLSVSQWTRNRAASVQPSFSMAREKKTTVSGDRPPTRKWARTARFRFAVAAGLAGAVLAIGWLGFYATGEDQQGVFAYETARGQREVFNLPDGSKVTLDADSALNVRLTAEQRALTLARGEAYFQVAKDSNRPFIVRAGATQVRAVGTAFNVRMSQDRTVVAVVEGKVEVTAEPTRRSDNDSSFAKEQVVALSGPAGTPQFTAQLNAGEAISYSEDGNLNALPAAEVSLATTWLDGRRQYRNEPLRYVLADVNRYAGRRIEVPDADAGDLRFTGTLNLGNTDAWLKGLSIALPVEVTEKEDGALLVTLTEKR